MAHTAREVSRGAFDLELLALKSLVEAGSANAADLTGMGFTLFALNKASHLIVILRIRRGPGPPPPLPRRQARRGHRPPGHPPP